LILANRVHADQIRTM